jgi:hypothetical protein
VKKFILITLLCALVVFGCDDKEDNDDDVIKERTTTVSLTDGLGSVTIKGVLTKPQLDDSANKIVGRLNALYTGYEGDTVSQGNIKSVLDRGVTYIVEANPEGYTKYKLIGDGKTIYIAFSEVDTNSVTVSLGGLYSNNINQQ